MDVQLKDYIATLKDQCEEQERWAMDYAEIGNDETAKYHLGKAHVLLSVIESLEELIK